MSSEIAIRLIGAGKCYPVGGRPLRRMWNVLFGQRATFDGFWALRGVDLEVRRGDAVGIVGHNGAGKSTLLQMVAGTLAASEGEIRVNGRVAALLELGAGFNPDFTGRENLYLTSAMSGLQRSEIAARFDEIVAFSGIEEFIDRPVKTYSSGMLVRLAFSIAVHVDPEVLIVDEALSVGDGEFARRSFDRIMHFRESGKTLLFCSHSLYQIEALCDRAVWLDHGIKRMEGAPADVTVAYDAALRAKAQAIEQAESSPHPSSEVRREDLKQARVLGVQLRVNGHEGVPAMSGESRVELNVTFSARGVASPSVAIVLMTPDQRCVTSASTANDGIVLSQRPDGTGEVSWVLDAVPLLKGEYFFDIYLMCERGIFVYEYVKSAAVLRVEQRGLAQGLVAFPHRWESQVPGVTGPFDAPRPSASGGI